MKTVATGPVPERTARGAGRAVDRLAGRRDEVAPFLEVDFEVALDVGLVEVFFCGVFRALRGVEPDRACPLREVLGLLREDVLELRDPGGEDVRVAMTPNLGDRHFRPRDHNDACRALLPLAPRACDRAPPADRDGS